MASTASQSRLLSIAAALVLYWAACLVVLAVVSPYAPQSAGFFWAPWTFLVIGAIALPMDVADGFGIDPVPVLLFLAGVSCLLAAVLARRLGWAALPGFSCLGVLGALQFSGGYG